VVSGPGNKEDYFRGSQNREGYSSSLDEVAPDNVLGSTEDLIDRCRVRCSDGGDHDNVLGISFEANSLSQWPQTFGLLSLKQSVEEVAAVLIGVRQ
jgi:hypothetical protein